ncbi:putative alpha-galactosidase B [Grifola frondosa]|uniref:Alpha-galactosidase n=1 Tax=Grifola frondosa TaxID=5627 RepID=A0A1C7M311_GRIFR|nr:putative alpha-galactosidase B [Grifola frondosa]
MKYIYSFTTLATIASVAVAQNQRYGQCGGIGWTGQTTYPSGWTCSVLNLYYSQCIQPNGSGSSSSTITSSAPAHSSSAASRSSSASSTWHAATVPTVGRSKQVGKTPALGWNSWNAHGCDISEAKVVAAANQFLSLGLKAAGYQYPNIDDWWSLTTRDALTGRIVPDPTKFPGGISGVLSQIHALAFSFGIYSDAGTATCAGFPGSLGRESLDAETFAEWDVDSLRSSTSNSDSAIRYRQMTAALNATARPLHFNLHIWDVANVGTRVPAWATPGASPATRAHPGATNTSIIATNVQHLSSINFFSHPHPPPNRRKPCLISYTLGSATAFLARQPLRRPTGHYYQVERLAFHQDSTVGTLAVPFTPSASVPTTSPPEYYADTSSKCIHVFIINTGPAATMKTFT